jgi:hypothetical protein
MGAPTGTLYAENTDAIGKDFLSDHFNNVALIVSKPKTFAFSTAEWAALQSRIKCLHEGVKPVFY